MRAFVRVLVVAATAATLAAPAAAGDISVGSCAGVRDVEAGTGGVHVGQAWVNVSGCTGPIGNTH